MSEYIFDDVYNLHGYHDRDEYLESLSEDYDIPLEVVATLADTLGPGEDFDGLVTTLEDAADYISLYENEDNYYDEED